MGKIIERNLPCRVCPSSDAAQLYDDGWVHCFSCNKNYKLENEGGYFDPVEQKHIAVSRTPPSLPNIEKLANKPVRGWADRKISQAVCRFYGVTSDIDPATDRPVARHYPWVDPDTKEIVGFKTRFVEKKEFQSVGQVKGLFGMHLFRNGGKRIVITEGEEDCLAVAEASYSKWNKFYPVVSLRSATGVKDVLDQRDQLRQFEEVILWLDNDKAGHKALNEIASIIGFDKVKSINSVEKDACDVLKQPGGDSRILSYIYDAIPYTPGGIVNSKDTWELYLESENLSFIAWPPCFPRLNAITYGRRLGTVTMLTAGTGVGKTSFLKTDQLHLLDTTNDLIGICSLEEPVAETVQTLMSMRLSKRLRVPSVQVSTEEKRAAWESTAGTGRFLILDHQASLYDSKLTDKIEFMALSGCKYIYLDHITIAASETASDKQNSMIDSLMNSLKDIAIRHGVWVCVVSHVRKVGSGEESFEMGAVPSEDDLKGSGSLKQIPWQTIALARNKYHEDPQLRNTTRIYVLKSRDIGETGPAGSVFYNADTGWLSPVETHSEENFELANNVDTMDI